MGQLHTKWSMRNVPQFALADLTVQSGMNQAKSLRIPKKAAATLTKWCLSTTLPHGQILRTETILRLGEGMTPSEVATVLRTTAKTALRWRNRFEAEGLDGLLERPRCRHATAVDNMCMCPTSHAAPRSRFPSASPTGNTHRPALHLISPKTLVFRYFGTNTQQSQR